MAPGVSLEANKTPIHTAKNPQAIRAVAERSASGGAGEIHRRGGSPELTTADGLRR